MMRDDLERIGNASGLFHVARGGPSARNWNR
jgi:hypothetical protein